MLLLQEFNLEIRDKKGVDNTIADHLSCIQGRADSMPIRDDFPNEQLLVSHGLLTYAISLSLPHSHQVHPKHIKQKLKVKQNIMYGTIPTFGEFAMTK
ncbi:hypothetical protein CR513_28350, partial [Mucuna pruriens]